jgi:RimJ/RimL family protein N-acetyltransferase
MVRQDGETRDACFDRLLALTDEGEHTGKAWRRAIIDHSGAFVGMAHMLDIKRGLTYRGDAGWWIATPHTRRGYGTEAVGAMIEHAMRDLPGGLGLHEVQAAIHPTNAPSKRIAERAGFRLLPGHATSIRLGQRWILHEIWLAAIRVPA